MTLLDIIQLLEPLVRLQACPLANPDHKQNLCPLHARVDQAIAAVEQIWGKSTIETLMVQLRGRHVGAALLTNAMPAIPTDLPGVSWAREGSVNRNQLLRLEHVRPNRSFYVTSFLNIVVFLFSLCPCCLFIRVEEVRRINHFIPPTPDAQRG